MEIIPVSGNARHDNIHSMSTVQGSAERRLASHVRPALVEPVPRASSPELITAPLLRSSLMGKFPVMFAIF